MPILTFLNPTLPGWNSLIDCIPKEKDVPKETKTAVGGVCIHLQNIKRKLLLRDQRALQAICEGEKNEKRFYIFFNIINCR